MASETTKDEWLDSRETLEQLGISSCQLSHIRENGKLRYLKEGNAYRYLKNDVRKGPSEGP
jgi:hypothetical protein